MLKPPFESSDALRQFVVLSQNHEFQEALPFFSSTELIACLTLLQSAPLILESNHKLENLFKFVDSPNTLNFLGKHFTTSLFFNYLNFLIQHPNFQSRLNHLLVGLPPPIFSRSLNDLQPNHLHILTQEGVFEPLQYLLTQFIHEGENLKSEIERKVLLFNKELLSINPNNLDINTLHDLRKQIDHLRNALVNYLERASIALAMVWNTNRIDQIEKLSCINEALQYDLIQVIGHASFEDKAPTGLYLMMEKTLAIIFDSSLMDDDSAIEGMTRLAIWHLKDYWELGLLPSIQNLEELELN